MYEIGQVDRSASTVRVTARIFSGNCRAGAGTFFEKCGTAIRLFLESPVTSTNNFEKVLCRHPVFLRKSGTGAGLFLKSPVRRVIGSDVNTVNY